MKGEMIRHMSRDEIFRMWEEGYGVQVYVDPSEETALYIEKASDWFLFPKKWKFCVIREDPKVIEVYRKGKESEINL